MTSANDVKSLFARYAPLLPQDVAYVEFAKQQDPRTLPLRAIFAILERRGVTRSADERPKQAFNECA